MKPGTKILLALKKFWKKYWKIVVIVAIIWTAVLIINNYLKNLPHGRNINSSSRDLTSSQER